MALRLDISDCTVLALCDDCPPWWALTRTAEAAETLALAHAWAVHGSEGTAGALVGTIEQRRRRTRGRTAAARRTT